MAPGRWIGGNESPSIFQYIWDSKYMPPHGANRGFYSNPEMDRLIADANATTDHQRRLQDYIRIQQIAARDLPSFNLFYLDSIVVHDRRMTNVTPNPSGMFDFLRTASLVPQLSR